jgi:hypothetical protein
MDRIPRIARQRFLHWERGLEGLSILSKVLNNHFNGWRGTKALVQSQLSSQSSDRIVILHAHFITTWHSNSTTSMLIYVNLSLLCPPFSI